jgi:hypothetical protein
VRLLPQRGLDLLGDEPEGGWVGCEGERVERGFLLVLREVELARRVVDEVGCDDAVEFFAEGLDCDLEGGVRLGV